MDINLKPPSPVEYISPGEAKKELLDIYPVNRTNEHHLRIGRPALRDDRQ